MLCRGTLLCRYTVRALGSRGYIVGYQVSSEIINLQPVTNFLSSAPVICLCSEVAFVANNMDPDQTTQCSYCLLP